MPFDPSNTSQGSSNSTSVGGFKDRRSGPRYTLIAEAQIVDVTSGSEFRARVSELGLHGCYLDFLNPIPDGSDIRLKITRDNGIFESPGKVVYNHPGMGLGIFFVNTAPAQQEILERWIAELQA